MPRLCHKHSFRNVGVASDSHLDCRPQLRRQRPSGCAGRWLRSATLSAIAAAAVLLFAGAVIGVLVFLNGGFLSDTRVRLSGLKAEWFRGIG